MAREIVVNAKMQRPGVCNAAESLVVHARVADAFLPIVAAALEGVELVGDDARPGDRRLDRRRRPTTTSPPSSST